MFIFSCSKVLDYFFFKNYIKLFIDGKSVVVFHVSGFKNLIIHELENKGVLVLLKNFIKAIFE